MKQLKFMLAAATAISLATAAQADLQKTLLDNGSQNFENFTAETTFADLASDGFSYPANDGENESAVAAKENSDPDSVGNWVLDVNTGTNPVLRALSPMSGTGVARNVDVEAEKKVYIDAMVQFTVTPVGDIVKESPEDKLMIYLAESTNDVDKTRTFTNLVVKAGKAIVDVVTSSVESVEPTDVVVSAEGLTVEANTWYNLKVEVTTTNNLPLFAIWINTKQLATQSDLGIGDDTRTLFPSLMGLYDEQSNPNAMILKSVGFAGEGKVDNLAFYKDVEVVTGIDFTLTVTGASAVWTTINDVQYNLGDNGKIALPPGTTSFTLEYTAETVGTYWNPQYTATLTAGDNCTVAGLVVTLGEGAPSATLEVTASEGSSAPEVTGSTTASSVGITTGAFADAKSEDLQNVLDWAVANGLSKTYVNEIAPFKDGTGEATNLVQEAYLLDCAPTPEAVNAAKAAFKFPAIVPGQVPAIDSDFSHNGTLTIKGATTLGVWKDIVGGKITVDSEQKDPTFFKAFLTK